MNYKTLTLAILASAVLPLSAAVKVNVLDMKAGDEAAKKAYFKQRIFLWGDKAYKAAPNLYHAIVTMTNSKTRFAFHLHGDRKDGKLVNVNIGMLRPSYMNWYAGEFIVIKQSAKKMLVTNASFSIKEAKGTDQSGVLELRYDGGDFPGTLRFELAEDDDKLLVTFSPDDKKAGYQVALYAYPGHYGDQKTRNRQAVTASKSGTGKIIPDPKDNWVLFYDAYYDKKLGRGDGCCGFLYNPAELAHATLRVGYGCTAFLDYGKGKDAHLILWDFKGWSSDQAKEFMKKLNVQAD